MSYKDFDEKIENEIIPLSHLSNKRDDDEKEKEKKKSEQLNNESLKLYNRINEEKNKELESTFKTPKLNIKSEFLIKLGKGKFIGFNNDEFII